MEPIIILRFRNGTRNKNNKEEEKTEQKLPQSQSLLYHNDNPVMFLMYELFITYILHQHETNKPYPCADTIQFCLA